MSDVILLGQIDFDSYENDDPIVRKDVGLFVGEAKGLSAHGKVKAWFDTQTPVRLYLGYDGEVYPQFILEKQNVI